MKTKKQLESFYGLASYFRKFIPGFSVIAKPLSDMKKENVKFEMGAAQVNSFNAIKKILSENPVLNIYNSQYETELHTDVSIDQRSTSRNN